MRTYTLPFLALLVASTSANQGSGYSSGDYGSGDSGSGYGSDDTDSGSGDYGSSDSGSGYGSDDTGSGNYGYDDCNLPQCFLEYDLQYKVELANMRNLNADEGDKTQSSMEECRTFCRDTYEEAEFFTYNENNKDCFCKVCHDLNATRREATGRVSGNVNCYTLPPCYTEDDVQYKVENEGLTNLNAADGDKEQDSMGDCRTYCRDTYAEAEYFTWNEGDRKCYCKTDNNLDVTRQDKSGRVSGNVQCDESV